MGFSFMFNVVIFAFSVIVFAAGFWSGRRVERIVAKSKG